MAKTTLDDITTGVNQAGTVNDNFTEVETQLNDKVLYRDNPAGEDNAMQSPLDMNSNLLTNLPTPSSASEAATKGYVDSLGTIDTETYVTQTTESFTATATQTVFNFANTCTPGANNLDVYINGVHQSSGSYTETDSDTITFTAGLEVGDLVTVRINARAVDATSTPASSVTHTPTGGSATDLDTTLKAILNASNQGILPHFLNEFRFVDTPNTVDAADINVDETITHIATTGAQAQGMADGSDGQLKIIIMITDGGDYVLTPSNLGNGTTITFDTVGDTAILAFSNSTWNFLGGTAKLDLFSGTATWNPGSIADGNEESQTVTVTGAVLGDFVLVSFSLDVQDLALVGQVTSADTVTANLYNNTGGSIDLGSGTLSAKVIK